MIDWSKCPEAERIPGKVSGAWLVVGARIPVQGILDSAEDGHSPEEIATEIFDGLEPELARRIIAFAPMHEPSSV